MIIDSYCFQFASCITRITDQEDLVSFAEFERSSSCVFWYFALLVYKLFYSLTAASEKRLKGIKFNIFNIQTCFNIYQEDLSSRYFYLLRFRTYIRPCLCPVIGGFLSMILWNWLLTDLLIVSSSYSTKSGLESTLKLLTLNWLLFCHPFIKL